MTLGSEEMNKNKKDSFNGYAEREGYGWFFRNMRDMFSSDDLTVVNLEGVLSDSEFQEDKTKTFRFRGPVDYAKILTQSGIEACAISNNHIYDFGKQGYSSTKAALSANGILFCGMKDYFVFEKDGAKIAFFALSNKFVTKENKEFVQSTIARLRAEEGVGAVVVCFHSGQEYSPHRRDRDQETYAKMAVQDWGADLVIMHHPHVLQGIDIINNRYVFYSLGNFCFGGNMEIRGQTKNPKIRGLESMVVQVDMEFSADGQYLGQQARFYPAYISSSATKVGDPNDFQPKFVTGAEAAGVVEAVQRDTKFDLGLMNEEEGCVELRYLAKP